MYNKESRIYFLENPYPNGHKLKEFKWSIRLIPAKGLWFDLHLETEKYYAEDESEDETEPESDWKAKIVWGNYHSCRMSSNYWHDGGFLGGSENKKFDFSKGNQNHFRVDPLPRPQHFDINEDRPFFTYLLGHDDCADHKITFQREGEDTCRIVWEGKIALSYSGDYDFKYRFSTEITEVEIPPIICPASLSDTEIKDLLSKYCIGYENLSIRKEEVKENIESTNDTGSGQAKGNQNPEANSSFWNTIKRLWS